MESPETDPHIHDYLIFNKDAKAWQRRNDTFFSVNSPGKIVFHMNLHHIHKLTQTGSKT